MTQVLGSRSLSGPLSTFSSSMKVKARSVARQLLEHFLFSSYVLGEEPGTYGPSILTLRFLSEDRRTFQPGGLGLRDLTDHQQYARGDRGWQDH